MFGSHFRMSLAGVAVATAAVACGGGPTASHVASVGGHATPTASADPRAAALQFAACMRTHGVNVQDPTFDQNGQPQWSSGLKDNQAAFQACAPIMQQANAGRTRSAPTAAQIAQLTRFAQCMRQHGLPDFPDPNPQTGSFPTNSDPTKEPGFAAAYQACKQLAPAGKAG